MAKTFKVGDHVTWTQTRPCAGHSINGESLGSDKDYEARPRRRANPSIYIKVRQCEISQRLSYWEGWRDAFQ